MANFVPVSGFLGAGKTTTLLAAARALTGRGRRVAVVTNDQGSELVDTRLARAATGRVAEVTGGCFCCRFDELAGVVGELVSGGADTVLAEAVGSCTDLRATVVRPLRARHGDGIRVAPLTAVVDPDRYALFARAWDTGADSDLAYLYRHQLAEADVIAVNKTDTLAAGRLPVLAADLARRFPHARQVAYSAASGDVAALLAAIEGPAGPDVDPPIDYDRYAAAEAELAWLNHSVAVTADGPDGFAPGGWAVAVLAALSDACADRGALVGHAKLTVDADGVLTKASLTEAGGAPRLDLPGPDRAARGTAVVNLRITGDPSDLDGDTTAALRAADAACRTSSTPAQVTGAFRPSYPRPTHRIPA